MPYILAFSVHVKQEIENFKVVDGDVACLVDWGYHTFCKGVIVAA
jgi:hypothetical protein